MLFGVDCKRMLELHFGNDDHEEKLTIEFRLIHTLLVEYAVNDDIHLSRFGRMLILGILEVSDRNRNTNLRRIGFELSQQHFLIQIFHRRRELRAVSNIDE
jgi:hypothetical protein